MSLPSINVNTIIDAADPVGNVSINVPSWFIVESMEITFGDYEGRPDVERVQLSRDILEYFFQQGWFIASVLSAGSDGKWQSMTTDESNAIRNVLSNSQKTSSAQTDSSTTENGTAESTKKETSTASSGSHENLESFATQDSASNFNTSNNPGSASGSSYGSGSSSSKGSAETSGTSSGIENSSENESTKKSSVESGTQSSSDVSSEAQKDDTTETATRTQDGDAYWSSWQKVRMQRRRISPRAVLTTMVGEITDSFNKGTKVVSDRYKAIVSLYATMINETGDAVNLDPYVKGFEDNFKRLIGLVNDAIKNIGIAENADDVNEAAELQRRLINQKFDAMKAQKRSDLLSRGLFNSTQWVMIAAGIERERSTALLEVVDKKLGWKVQLAGSQGPLINALQNAMRALFDAQEEGVVKPVDMRNNVMKWMLDYAANHETPYSKIQEIPQLVAGLDDVAGGYPEKD